MEICHRWMEEEVCLLVGPASPVNRGHGKVGKACLASLFAGSVVQLGSCAV